MSQKGVDYDYCKLRGWGIGALTALKICGMAWRDAKEEDDE